MIKKIVAYSLRDFLAAEDGQEISKEEKAALSRIDDAVNELIQQAESINFFSTNIDTEKHLAIKNTIYQPDDESPASLKVELSIGDGIKAANFFDPDCLIVVRLDYENLFIDHVWRDEDYKRVLR